MPTISVSCKQGVFRQPQALALTKTLFWAICSHQHRDLEAPNVLSCPPPPLPWSSGPLFQFPASKGLLECCTQYHSPKLYFWLFAHTKIEI